VKLFNASNLDSGIKQVKQSIDTLENQLQDLRKQIDYFTGLDDNFTGKSGKSIRMFYQEVHIPFILLFEQTIRQYKAAINVAEKLFFLFEPADDGYIEESFLETEIEQGLKKAAEMTHQLVEDVNDALGSIRDIMSIKHLTDENFYMDVQRAKRFTQRTINQLHQTDHGRAQDLTDTETDLQLLQKYITEIRSMFQSKDVTIANYTFRKFATNATYKEVLSEIEQNAHYTLDELYGTSPYLPNTYVEARYPGPNAHLDMLMKNRYRDSIEDRIEAANIISELTDTKITKEEFESLEERLVEVVSVIDDVDSVKSGDYYVYDDGLIIRVNIWGQYDIVNHIPNNRGGTRALDSFLDETLLEPVEYIARPGKVIEKPVTRYISKKVNSIGKSVTKGQNKVIGENIEKVDVRDVNKISGSKYERSNRNYKEYRNASLNEIKRQLGIIRSQHPISQKMVPLTDRDGNRILNDMKQPIMTRELTYEVNGKIVIIQDHSVGHKFGEGGIGDQPPHYNVRPPENIRTGKVKGMEEHYYFNKRNKK